MLNARITIMAGLLGFCLAGPARAQDPKPLQPSDYAETFTRIVAANCSAPTTTAGTGATTLRMHRQDDSSESNPFPLYFAVRGGGMISPRVEPLVGFDVTMPALGLGRTSVARIDADFLFNTRIVGSDTAIPITFDEIYRVPGVNQPYLGLGLGTVLGNKPKFMVKAVLGIPLAKHFAAELNADWIGNRTVLLALGRLKF